MNKYRIKEDSGDLPYTVQRFMGVWKIGYWFTVAERHYDGVKIEYCFEKYAQALDFIKKELRAYRKIKRPKYYYPKFNE